MVHDVGLAVLPSISTPTVAEAPGAREAFQLAGVTVTVLPEVVAVPFHSLPSVVPGARVKTRVQVVAVAVAAAALVTVKFALYPVVHELVTAMAALMPGVPEPEPLPEPLPEPEPEDPVPGPPPPPAGMVQADAPSMVHEPGAA